MNYVFDIRGKKFERKEYKKIVSLVPSLTETLFDLGLGNNVIGVTRYCISPPEAMKPPRVIVGGPKSPKIKLIKELHPDIVVANKEENQLKHVQEIESFAPVFVTYPTNIHECIKMLNDLTLLFNKDHDPHVQRKIKHIENTYQKISTAERNHKKTLRVFCPIWKNPWMSINKNTFIHSMLEAVGFVNIFSGKEDRYPQVTLEEIREAKPDIVLLPDEPYHFNESDVKELHKELHLPIERIKLIKGKYLIWYGMRIDESLTTLFNLVKETTNSQ